MLMQTSGTWVKKTFVTFSSSVVCLTVSEPHTSVPLSPLHYTSFPIHPARAASLSAVTTSSQSAVSSHWRGLMSEFRKWWGDVSTYHALESLGQLVGLKHVFAFFVLGTVHHLRAVIDRLLCERRGEASDKKKNQILYFKELTHVVAASVRSPQLKLMAPTSSR